MVDLATQAGANDLLPASLMGNLYSNKDNLTLQKRMWLQSQSFDTFCTRSKLISELLVFVFKFPGRRHLEY